MRRTIVAALLATALAGTGCARPASEPESVTFRYSLDAGDSFTYRTEYSMGMTTEVEGLPMGEVADGPIDIDLTAGLTAHYAVADGPEEGTHAVTFSYDEVSDLAMTMTGGGEEVTFTEDDLAGELAGSGLPMPGNQVEFVVDASGHILSLRLDGDEIELPAMGGSGMSAFGSEMPFLGPELPDGPVSVGDSWTAEWSVQPFPGADMEVSALSRLVAVETLDGVEVYVIETTTTSTPLEVDLADLLGGLGGEASGLPDDLEVSMTMSPAPNRGTAWFDPARGITVRQEFAGGGDITMSFRGQGESGTVTLHTSMEGSLQLVD